MKELTTENWFYAASKDEEHWSGPFCPGGDNGCNAMGCYGTRSRFIEMMGRDTWLWVGNLEAKSD